MRIIVVRHPETEANIRKLIYGRTESPYTEQGLLSIQWVLSRLKGRKIDGIYTSPLQRTAVLAAEIASQQGCEMTIIEDLREMDFGVFENMTRMQAEERYSDYFKAYMADYANYRIPKGESFSDVSQRLSRFIKPLLSGKGTMVLVTHGMVMKAAIALLLGMTSEAVWHFRTEPATILEVDYREGYGVLVELTSPMDELI